MTTVFISDLHLEPQNERLTQGFIKFLNHLPHQTDALYILGDFFELWIGDDYSDLFTEQIKSHLNDASKQFPIYFMHGNRDFLIGEKFALSAGFTIIPDPFIIQCHGYKLLLSHGDSLCTQDTAYMQMRSIIRNPAWQADFLSQSIEQRLDFAHQLQNRSNSDKAVKSEKIMDVTPEEVIKIMQTHKVHMMLHGHTHRPNIHQFSIEGQSAKRIVLGDWGESGWMAQMDESGCHLSKFSLAV